MFAGGAGILALLILSGGAQGQDDDIEVFIPHKTCANAPFSYVCPLELVMNIRSVVIFADLSDPTPVMALNNNSCPLSLSRCSRTFKDQRDRAFKDLPEYEYFYKWLHITCEGKRMCNGTMPAPNRLHGINIVCSSVDISYFVALYVDIACVRNRTFEDHGPLPETTTVPTLKTSRLVPYTDRVISTVAALERTTQKPANNLLNVLIGRLWPRNEGSSSYFGGTALHQCLISLSVLAVVLHFEP